MNRQEILAHLRAQAEQLRLDHLSDQADLLVGAPSPTEVAETLTAFTARQEILAALAELPEV